MLFWSGLLIEIQYLLAVKSNARYDKETKETTLLRICNRYNLGTAGLVSLTVSVNLSIYAFIFLGTWLKEGESCSGTESTLPQQVFIILWLVFGSLYGILAGVPPLQRLSPANVMVLEPCINVLRMVSARISALAQ
jgi:hypothetical protein